MVYFVLGRAPVFGMKYEDWHIEKMNLKFPIIEPRTSVSAVTFLFVFSCFPHFPGTARRTVVCIVRLMLKSTDGSVMGVPLEEAHSADNSADTPQTNLSLLLCGVRRLVATAGIYLFIYLFIYLDIQRRPRDNQWLFLSR